MIASVAVWIQWIELATGIAALLGGLLAAIWAYAKLILERGLLPPSEFDVGCTVIGVRGTKRVLQLEFRIQNKGRSTLVVSDLRAKLRYAGPEEPRLFKGPADPRFGSVRFEKSLLRDDLERPGEIYRGEPGRTLEVGHRAIKVGKEGFVELGPEDRVFVGAATGHAHDAISLPESSGIPVVPYDTFVQPGVKQTYTLITAIPESAVHALVHGSFRYGLNPTESQLAIHNAARKLGLVQHRLKRVTEPHTAQRAFDLSDPGAPASG